MLIIPGGYRGDVIFISMTDFKRLCPKCGKELTYTRKDHFNRAVSKNSTCKPCFYSNREIHLKRRNILRSEEIREKISNGTKEGMLKTGNGYRTAEQNRKCQLKRMERLGISACEDEGAREWFDRYNKETNSNFQPKRFDELGYFADGYDETRHIWIEYDTKYHSMLYQQKKDEIRQNNIVEYFQKLGKPLVKFIRVLAYTNHKIVDFL